MTVTTNEIAERIKMLQEQRNVTMKAMLTSAGLGKNTYQNIYNGSMPSADKIAAIATALKVTSDYLLCIEREAMSDDAVNIGMRYDKLSDDSQAVVKTAIVAEERHAVAAKTPALRSSAG